MEDDPKKEALRKLTESLRARPDATAVNNLPSPQPKRSIGPVTKGNTPLPEASVQSQYQPKYDKAMNILADMIPVLGTVRGVQQGHSMAQGGNPLLGAIAAASSLAPEGGNIAGKVTKSIATHSETGATKELLDHMMKTADKIVANKQANIERVNAAAMKFGDRYFQGYNHGGALRGAIEGGTARSSKEWNRGYMTTNNRFIDEDEAAVIGQKSGIIPGNHPNNYLVSEDFSALDPKYGSTLKPTKLDDRYRRIDEGNEVFPSNVIKVMEKIAVAKKPQ